ncbi:MAG: ATP-binding cassette domain-containing protein, partial [Desulfobacterales bacterium]
MDQPLIQIKNATKSFGDVRVLDGVNLSIYRGQITSIVGQSGTGKSVLLKHIIGLLKPDSGEVLFDGKAFAAMKKDERKALKKKFSYVFQ